MALLATGQVRVYGNLGIDWAELNNSVIDQILWINAYTYDVPNFASDLVLRTIARAEACISQSRQDIWSVEHSPRADRTEAVGTVPDRQEGFAIPGSSHWRTSRLQLYWLESESALFRSQAMLAKLSRLVLPFLALYLTLFAGLVWADDYPALQGKWVGYVGRYDSKGRFQEEGYIELVIKDKTIVGYKRGGEWMGEGTFTLDSTAKTITVQGIKGPYRERYLGSYRLEGNEFRWATTRGGARRATLPPSHDDDVVLVLRRHK